MSPNPNAPKGDPFHPDNFSKWEPGIMIDYPRGKSFFPASWVEGMVRIELIKAGNRIIIRSEHHSKDGVITLS